MPVSNSIVTSALSQSSAETEGSAERDFSQGAYRFGGVERMKVIHLTGELPVTLNWPTKGPPHTRESGEAPVALPRACS